MEVEFYREGHAFNLGISLVSGKRVWLWSVQGNQLCAQLNIEKLMLPVLSLVLSYAFGSFGHKTVFYNLDG